MWFTNVVMYKMLLILFIWPQKKLSRFSNKSLLFTDAQKLLIALTFVAVPKMNPMTDYTTEYSV
jgi:hypothetical protein